MNLSDSQNFLKDSNLVKNLVNNTEINKDDTVFDIGAGMGIITLELSKICKKVIAVELDKNLYEQLKIKFANTGNVEILNQDFLLMNLPGYDYKIFSNIPFNQTSDIINKLYFSSNPPQDAYFVMQKEASLRFMGIGEGALMSLLLKPYFNLSIVHNFEKSDFSPMPGVDPVLFRIKKLKPALIDDDQKLVYRDFISYIILQQKTSFKKRIKKLFLPAEFFHQCSLLKINPISSINEISFEQFLELFVYFISLKNQKSYFEKIKLISGSFEKYLYVRNDQKKMNRTKI